MALAVIIMAEEGTHTEKKLNSQTMKEDTTFEDESSTKDEKLEIKEEQQEREKQTENEEEICQHRKNVSKYEEECKHNEQSVLENKDKGLQSQGEENTKTQPADKEKHFNADINPKEGEVEVSELHHYVKEWRKEEEGEETKGNKHKNETGEGIRQVKKSGSLEEQSDQQEAQNNRLENRQQTQHLGHLSEGYRVTEPEHDEEHPAESQRGLNYLSNYHEDHNGHNLQYASKIFEHSFLSGHYGVQAHTLTDKYPVPQNFPVYIPEGKHASYPVVKTVSYPTRQHVSRPVPTIVHEPVPYTVYKPIPFPVKVPVARPYFVHVPVEKRVPFPVHVKVPVPQPYAVHVPKPYAVLVEKKVPAPYPVRVEVPVSQPYPVEVKVPVPVDRHVPVPVKVPVERPIPVPVEKPYPVVFQKEVHYPVEKKVPYPVKVRSEREQTSRAHSEAEQGDNYCYKERENRKVAPTEKYPTRSVNHTTLF